MFFMLRRVYSSVLILTIVVSILMATPRPAQAGYTIEVTTFDDAQYGWQFTCSLRDAITAANTDNYFAGCHFGHGADTIVLEAGTYKLTLPGSGDNLPQSGDLDITSNLTIIGKGSQAGGTIIDASGLGDRAFHIRPASGGIIVNLIGLSIKGGTAINATAGSYNGGGILNGRENLLYPTDKPEYSSLSLNDVVVNGSLAGTPSIIGSGGGVANGKGGTLSILNSTISGNQASYGGGILNYGTLVINNSSITGNFAIASVPGAGGGLDNRPLDMTYSTTISGSIFSGNQVTAGGFAGIASSGRLSIQNSKVINNIGIGMNFSQGSTATINDVTISGNITADADSAAGVNSAGNLTLTSSVISNNTGGGIFLKSGTGTLRINNTNVDQNTGIGVRVDFGVTGTITNSIITANGPVGSNTGAGIDLAGNLTLQYNTVAGNKGIGLMVRQKIENNTLYRGVANVTNSTIGENTDTGVSNGVGIDNAGELHLANITLAHNSNTGLLLEDGSITDVKNSILTGNGQSNCVTNGSNTFSRQSTNLVYPPDSGPGACLFAIGSGDLGDDPHLSNQLANNGSRTLTQTYAIEDGLSPAVDAAPSAGCPFVDQRLMGRPVITKGDAAMGCDIGAYEFGGILYFSNLPILQR